MTMVKISDFFYYIINLLCFALKLVGMICKLDRFLENLQIELCNLQIGEIGRLDGTCRQSLLVKNVFAVHVLKICLL